MCRLLCLSSFLSIILLSACDPGESDPGNGTHCDDTRCYTLGMAFECSEDGRQLYQYINPTDHLMTEIYKSEFEPGTNYIKFHCDDDAKCMANDDGAGCFKPCGVQKTGSVGWCSSQTNETDATIYMTHTTTECELIDGQYVYFDDVPWR